MAAAGTLRDVLVLVVEDDYFLADDARTALTRAGAKVLGPYPDAERAMKSAARDKPDCAVLDVNLGGGPDFEPARKLMAQGVSVIFITGYDIETIPEDLLHVPRVQKPVSDATMVQAVVSSCGKPAN